MCERERGREEGERLKGMEEERASDEEREEGERLSGIGEVRARERHEGRVGDRGSDTEKERKSARARGAKGGRERPCVCVCVRERKRWRKHLGLLRLLVHYRHVVLAAPGLRVEG